MLAFTFPKGMIISTSFSHKFFYNKHKNADNIPDPHDKVNPAPLSQNLILNFCLLIISTISKFTPSINNLFFSIFFCHILVSLFLLNY